MSAPKPDVRLADMAISEVLALMPAGPNGRFWRIVNGGAAVGRMADGREWTVYWDSDRETWACQIEAEDRTIDTAADLASIFG